jgi:hypothetical protein
MQREQKIILEELIEGHVRNTLYFRRRKKRERARK